ncbi:hypothetical protein D3C71_1133070 [compost metagenome]
MPGRMTRCLSADFRATGQQREQAQLQRLRPGAVIADAIQPGAHGTQHIDVFKSAERFDVGIPAIPREQLTQRVIEKQAAMADVRHQRNWRQLFHPHPRFIGINHRQTQTRIFARLFTARGHQQPVGGIAGGDEILAPAQAQTAEPGLHVRRAQAALLGRTQGAEA